MTGLTPLYELPYQQAADAPCDGAEVWCDFATQLNTVMGSLKDTVDRIEPTVPLALVGNTQSNIITGSPATLVMPWDTIYADTDRMVDFDFSNRVVFPRRPGIYCITAQGYAYPLGGTAIFQYINASIINTFTGYPLPFSTGGSAQVGAISNDIQPNLPPGNPNVFHARAFARITTADMNLSASNLGGFAFSMNPGGNDFGISGMRMGVYYMRDA